MSQAFDHWVAQLRSALPQVTTDVAYDDVTMICSPDAWLSVCQTLRDHAQLQCDQLIDLCVVDYLHFGLSEWKTNDGTRSGYSRGRHPLQHGRNDPDGRFEVVVHLLSTRQNQRVRVKTRLPDGSLTLPTLTSLWSAVNWFEREAYDLFGVRFEGHPDLRRILTDYGFKDHPLRKDFPLSGTVEMGYDATEKRCVYRPVDIQPRVTVPKVIRHDHRYIAGGQEKQS